MQLSDFTKHLSSFLCNDPASTLSYSYCQTRCLHDALPNVMTDVKASQVLYDRVAALGGKPLMWKTGHSLIKAKMKETGAPLAGEMSGHIFFAHRYRSEAHTSELQ